MSVTASTLQPYVPNSLPNMPGSQERYLPEELRRVATTLNQLIQVVKQLDARLTAHGF